MTAGQASFSKTENDETIAPLIQITVTMNNAMVSRALAPLSSPPSYDRSYSGGPYKSHESMSRFHWIYCINMSGSPVPSLRNSYGAAFIGVIVTVG